MDGVLEPARTASRRVNGGVTLRSRDTAEETVLSELQTGTARVFRQPAAAPAARSGRGGAGSAGRGRPRGSNPTLSRDQQRQVPHARPRCCYHVRLSRNHSAARCVNPGGTPPCEPLCHADLVGHGPQKGSRAPHLSHRSRRAPFPRLCPTTSRGTGSSRSAAEPCRTSRSPGHRTGAMDGAAASTVGDQTAIPSDPRLNSCTQASTALHSPRLPYIPLAS